MPTPRAIQRTYLVLLLGNTLAASLIWGINTIFLLDAGLSNLEAFAANAFFTAGLVAGGFIAAQTSLGVPFVVRGVILVVMFGVAFRLMHDVGFTAEKGGRPVAEMRRIASASIDYGWRVPAVKWLMCESLVTGG